jgi:hypothetical protein
MSTAERINRRLDTLGEGFVFTPRDMLDLGSRQAVDQALSRLARAKVIRRLTRGLYDYPRRDPVFGLRAASADAIAKALARETDSTLQVAGAQAANQLGWSEQVPAKTVYLTNGTRRSVRLGSRVITLRPASPKNLLAAGTKAGSVVQAFRFLGPTSREFVQEARSALTPEDRSLLAREASRAADWLRPVLEEVARP